METKKMTRIKWLVARGYKMADLLTESVKTINWLYKKEKKLELQTLGAW